MKILVATKQTQGTRKNDLSFAEEGELVGFAGGCGGGSVDDKCGCKRSMTGLRSHKNTTTVMVVERDVDLATEIRKARFEQYGVSDPLGAEIEARELTRIASVFRVGEVIEIRGKKMQSRVVAGKAAA